MIYIDHRIPNTFGIDVTASRYIEYTSGGELLELVSSGVVKPPFLHIGSGSNLLFTKDFQGTVLHSLIKDISEPEIEGDKVRVRVGAGWLWDDFVEHCVLQEWYGAENLSLIPGEVGAAAVQNIGAYGAEVRSIIESVEAVDASSGEERVFNQAECRYSYRNSIFKCPEYKKYIVTHVTFSLSRIPALSLDYGGLRSQVTEETLRGVRDAVITTRRSKLPEPSEVGSAGSFFMNPIVPKAIFEQLREQFPEIPGYPVPDVESIPVQANGAVDPDEYVKLAAGWLIQQCGWKGCSVGRAGVWEKQALVLVNRGGASGNEIMALADAIINSVQEKFGITLNKEVNVI